MDENIILEDWDDDVDINDLGILLDKDVKFHVKLDQYNPHNNSSSSDPIAIPMTNYRA